MKNLLVNASLVLISIMISIVLLETTLHFTSYAEILNRTYFPDGLFISDKELGYVMAPNYATKWFTFKGPGHWVFTNKQGLFDTPFNPDVDKPYLLAVGDSLTWGYAPLEKKWTTVLQNQLNIRVLKCGLTGTGTLYQFIFLKRIFKELVIDPLLVIHLYSPNDFADDFVFPGFSVIEGQRVKNYSYIELKTCKKIDISRKRLERSLKAKKSDRRSWLAKHSVFYNLYKKATEIRRGRRIASEFKNHRRNTLSWRYQYDLLNFHKYEYSCVSEKLEEHMNTLLEMKKFLENKGIVYVVFLYGKWNWPESSLGHRLREFFAKNYAYTAELSPEGTYKYDRHWNPEGNRRVALEILQYLKEWRLI